MKEQGIKVTDNILYQDNKSAIQWSVSNLSFAYRPLVPAKRAQECIYFHDSLSFVVLD